MHCLVTGGAGFVGSHLVDLLLESGHNVSVFDNFSSGRKEFLAHHGDTINVIEGDLLDLDAVKDAMMGIEMVFHLAANPDIRLGTSITDTDLKQGTVATYNVLEAMRVKGVMKIAFASSSVVYGEANEMPTPEDYGPLFPISLYGASKLGSEALITSWVGTFGLQAWIFRFANIIYVCELYNKKDMFSGCSLVRLKCWSGGPEIGGSNPLIPTFLSSYCP